MVTSPVIARAPRIVLIVPRPGRTLRFFRLCRREVHRRTSYPEYRRLLIRRFIIKTGFYQRITTLAKNVFGDDLLVCSAEPLTGFFRTGRCDTCGEDQGMHTVCAEMTAEFLKFSKKAGNDLSTQRPEYNFPGLKPGDRWCLCLPRWIEALEAGMAPKLALKATHISAIEHISMDVLLEYALDADDYVPEPANDDDDDT